MKNVKFVILSLFVAAVAFATAQGLGSVDIINSPKPQWIQSGVFLGTPAKNPISDIKNKQAYHLCGTMVYDFPSIPATGANSGCQQGPGVTVTGCGFNNSVSLGIDQVPPTLKNGAPPIGYISAADTLNVSICNDSSDGGAVDFPDASFTLCCDGY